MKSKKAFLLGEHTINIIVGILAIVILVLVGMGIFGIFSVDNKAQQAQSNLGNIMAVISRLEKKDSGGSETKTIASPQDWILVGWPNDGSYYPPVQGPSAPAPTTYSNKLPKQCSNNNWNKCLCFCSSSSGYFFDDCNSQGICQDVSNYGEVSVGGSSYVIKIDKPKTIEITLDKQNNKLSIIEK